MMLRAAGLLGVLVGAAGCRTPPSLAKPAGDGACWRLAEQLVTVSSAMSASDHVHAARVSDCQVEILPACDLGGSYQRRPVSTPLPEVTVMNREADFQRVLPLDPELAQRGWSLVEAQADGEAPADHEPTRSDLGAGCEGATHYVERIWLGYAAIRALPSLEVLASVGQIPSDPAQPASPPAVIGFALRELRDPSRATCSADKVWDGSGCAVPLTTDRCPPGAVTRAEGCVTPSIQLPEDPMSRERARPLLETLERSSEPEERAALLMRLRSLYAPGERERLATVYRTLSEDESIAAACAIRTAAAAELPPSLALRYSWFGGAPEPEPPPEPPPQPAWCERVAEGLAAYAQLLAEERHPAAMTEIHLRLIREFPKSPSSAEAYRRAADQLCADRRYREANRLYDYIRATFGKTPTAQRLPAEPCRDPDLAPKAASEPRKGS